MGTECMLWTTNSFEAIKSSKEERFLLVHDVDSEAIFHSWRLEREASPQLYQLPRSSDDVRPVPERVPSPALEPNQEPTPESLQPPEVRLLLRVVSRPQVEIRSVGLLLRQTGSLESRKSESD